MKKLILFVIAAVTLSSCAMIDTSEVGIKFSKFALTDQGKLDAVTVTGMVVFNPFTTSVYTYPVFIQNVNYDPFTVTTKDAAVFTILTARKIRNL